MDIPIEIRIRDDPRPGIDDEFAVLFPLNVRVGLLNAQGDSGVIAVNWEFEAGKSLTHQDHAGRTLVVQDVGEYVVVHEYRSGLAN